MDDAHGEQRFERFRTKVKALLLQRARSALKDDLKAGLDRETTLRHLWHLPAAAAVRTSSRDAALSDKVEHLEPWSYVRGTCSTLSTGPQQ